MKEATTTTTTINKHSGVKKGEKNQKNNLTIESEKNIEQNNLTMTTVGPE